MSRQYAHFRWLSDLAIHSIDYCPDERPAWREHWHSIPYQELVVVSGNGLRFQRGDAKLILNHGDFLLLSPHEAHASWGVDPTDAGFFFIQFSCKTEDEGIDGHSSMLDRRTTLTLPISGNIKNEWVIQGLAELVEEWRGERPYSYLRCVSRFADICVTLARDAMTLKGNTHAFNVGTPRQAEIVTNVIQFLKMNKHVPFTAEEIQRSLNLNYEYICRVFKRATGKTITEYGHYLRIRRARQLLVETNDCNSISEVAERLGYSSTAYFSRIFRHYEGVSPRQFVKNVYGMQTERSHQHS